MMILPVSDNLEAPTCNSCKHLLGRRDNFHDADKWKCAAPQNLMKEGRNVITGQIQKFWKFANCIQARCQDIACGESGKWHEKYEYPVEQYTPVNLKPVFGSNATAVPSARLAQIRAAAGKKKLTNDDLSNL